MKESGLCDDLALDHIEWRKMNDVANPQVIWSKAEFSFFFGPEGRGFNCIMTRHEGFKQKHPVSNRIQQHIDPS